VSYRRVTVADFGSAVMTAADVKPHLRVDYGDDDALLESYIEEATRFVEKRTGTAMRAQTWVLTLDRFPRHIQLPGGRVTSVVSIEYVNAERLQVILAEAEYTVTLGIAPAVMEAQDVWPGTQPREGAVAVTYTVDGSNEPGLMQAVRMLVAHWYEFREPVGTEAKTMPFGLEDLLNMYGAAWYG